MQKLKIKKPLKLELGSVLKELTIAYHTIGKLNANKNNVVWITHALTGDTHPEKWWSGLVGKGKLYDPSDYFIICANVPGSVYGSTGPLSINPDTGQFYYQYFPELTIRDIVKAFELLRAHLGIGKIHTIIGGSLGGQQALEWAVSQPGLFDYVIPIAASAKHSPWGVALNETQRMAIQTDPTWHAQFPDAAKKGLRAARAIALLSYRNQQIYNITQHDGDRPVGEYRAASYQQYQGDKFVRRFNAYAYWFLTKAMDSHDIGRNRGGIKEALKRIEAKVLFLGINSDILFPTDHIQEIAFHTPNAQYREIESLYGHDGFLLEFEQIDTFIQEFYISTKQEHYELHI